jgi:hypothetical protein
LPLFGAGLVVVGDLADGVGVEEEQAGEAVLVAVDLGGRGVAQDGQDLGAEARAFALEEPADGRRGVGQPGVEQAEAGAALLAGGVGELGEAVDAEEAAGFFSVNSTSRALLMTDSQNTCQSWASARPTPKRSASQ